MSAQELYVRLQLFIVNEKRMLINICDQNDDWIMGRLASLKDIENFLDKLDPEIFPDLGEDEK